jgi:hypothetical protein
MLDPESVDRRERWFVEGAAALRQTLTAIGLADALSPTGEFYACPCCLTAYGRDALDARFLTVEHVPPRWAGGRELVLTCRDCNSTAGSAFDAHAERREAIHNLLAGRGPDRAVRAEFKVGDVITRGNIHYVGNAFLMVGVPRANNPKDIAETTRALDALATKGAGGQIEFRLTEGVSVTRARLSWVRAAYLAAFAARGWRYAFLEHLNLLRAQLADPAASLLPPLAMIDQAAPRERRRLLVVREPEELRSLAVVLGSHTVFLPGLEDPQPFEVISAALARLSAMPTPRPQLVGKEIPWPTKPLYALDR